MYIIMDRMDSTETSNKVSTKRKRVPAEVGSRKEARVYPSEKKRSCCNSTYDYEAGSIIKALLVKEGFLDEKGEVLDPLSNLSPKLSILPDSLPSWLASAKHKKQVSRTDGDSFLSFLDDLPLVSQGAQQPETPDLPSVSQGAQQPETDQPEYIILITTHGTISQDKTIVPSEYTTKIVTITASTPGTVNYVSSGEVKKWMTEIEDIGLDSRFDTMGTIGANIKEFAENNSPYYKRARQVHDQFGSDRISRAIEYWNKCSLVSLRDSTMARADFENYYDNAAFGYDSWYNKISDEAQGDTAQGGSFYDKTYKNKGLKDTDSKTLQLGLIKILKCGERTWKNFPIDKNLSGGKHVTFNEEDTIFTDDKECKLSDILYTIENGPYDNVVIIDLTCSVPSPEYLDCLYAYCPGVSDAMSEGGSKSKKRKRKSNKTRKRRRKPSRNPRKHKKHQKSKRNPNKRRTKRK
jgi:hypothetical protein